MIKDIQLKRVYDNVENTDGLRVLVDGIWPRGIKKEELKADWWLKEIAPRKELRKWFAHDPAKWKVFKNQYFAELNEKTTLVHELLEKAADKRLTLLFAARDTECNNAAALKEYLESMQNENE